MLCHQTPLHSVLTIVSSIGERTSAVNRQPPKHPLQNKYDSTLTILDFYVFKCRQKASDLSLCTIHIDGQRKPRQTLIRESILANDFFGQFLRFSTLSALESAFPYCVDTRYASLVTQFLLFHHCGSSVYTIKEPVKDQTVPRKPSLSKGSPKGWIFLFQRFMIGTQYTIAIDCA